MDENSDLTENQNVDGENQDTMFFKEPSNATEIERQHSTTEYLNGMLHTKSPGLLLPLFSSFSLVKIGNYSWYDPSAGLRQSGFIQNNFLCFWDVRTPRGSDQGNRSNVWKNYGSGNSNEVKVYLGNEYECALGHRFFAHHPEKIFKSLGKDNARKILNSDVPLYFPCPCK